MGDSEEERTMHANLSSLGEEQDKNVINNWARASKSERSKEGTEL